MKNFNTPDTFFRRTLALCLLVLAVFVAGCSSVRFTYNQGDTLLYWWLDSYADLEGEQADIAKRDIDKLFQWHRQTQLRDYAALLGNMQRQLAGNTTQADLVNVYKEIRLRGERLAGHAVPEMTTLALSIKPDQIADIERKFISKNQDYRRKFIEGSTEKRQRARFKKAMNQLELWFGNFSREQEDILRKTLDARPLDNEAWLEERVWRQRRILALLRKFEKEKPNREQASAQIVAMQRELFGRIDSPERKAFYDAGIDHTTKFILTAIRIATPAQKKHAHDRMQGWINDFQALAAGK
ncbi:DUF6279 family lipoprotein [Massilia oculi]|uniref:DUF6279 family lipoprotein n=1 Tax=Massilia hydrophila TaxID=3044279 RepID=A0ABS7Y7U0_9BURK|nr:DUF6279 family lipoprotein [Massilia oculi]MCA1855746.1 DUF6279 family lipoprotein [Massilia oculi]